MEESIEELIDSTLTPEEEELIKKHKEMIKKGDFSEFIDAEDLCIE
jgi:thioredoxin-like negative regulator of GroEL